MERISAVRMKRYLFAVWSEQGGQDDLVWYEAVQEGETYMVTIPIANHMTTEDLFYKCLCTA